MNEAYLLIGGNIGDRLAYLQQAREMTEEFCGPIKKKSGVYETAAWGSIEQPAFYNQALLVQTTLEPEELMRRLLNIETKMGRHRVIKSGPRIIDMDILLINGKIINSEILTVPHPHLTERRFALTPLAEIAGNIIHPTAHKSITQLLETCKDMLEVHLIFA